MYFRRHIPRASRYLLKPHPSATCMIKLLRFGFETGIPWATIMGKLKVRTKTDEKKLVILLPHPLSFVQAISPAGPTSPNIIIQRVSRPLPPAALASVLSARVAGSPPRRSPRNSEHPGPRRSPRHCGAPAGNG